MQKQKSNFIKRVTRNKAAYLLLAPFFILFAMFTVLPVCISVWYSFTYYNMLSPAEFLGIENYTRLFFEDGVFLQAMRNTFVFAILTGPAGYLMSLGIAWLVNELSPKIRAAVILLFYAPSISGNVYLVWKLLFSSDSYGYINGFLIKWGFISSPVTWLQNPKYILMILVIVQLWMSLGTGFLAFVAGLQGIDRTLYEAGAMDGIRNRWQELWFITLPTMKPQLAFGAVLAISGAFAVSDISINMAGFPSVQYAGETIVTHLLDYGSIRYKMGYASSIAVTLFCITVSCNKLVNRLLRRVGE